MTEMFAHVNVKILEKEYQISCPAEERKALIAGKVEDGQRMWAKRGFGEGSLILADGHLIILSERGQLLLAKATPEGFEEVSRFQALEGKSWTSPALAGGKLYIRNLEQMMGLDLKG